MGQVRTTQESILRRRKDIGLLEERIRRWDVLQKGKESEFWKTLKESLEAGCQGMEALIGRILDKQEATPEQDYPNLRYARGQLRSFREILTDVEDGPKKIDRARQEIIILKDEIERADKAGGLLPGGRK